MNSKYLRIINAFFGATWAIMPEKLDAMSAFLKFAANGGKYSPEEVAEQIGPKAAGGRQSGSQASTIAVIPIQGIIDQKAARVDDISGPGGTSTEQTAKSLRSALADQTVKAIILDIDSPGGTVYGVDELATEIYKSRGSKPIVSMVNSLCASAAYWLASSADEIVITPSGEAGSIGVYSQHVDVSKFLEAAGQKVTLISAGEFKVEGNPFEPMTDEARAYVQTRVDDYYGAFTKAVARGRGVGVAKVRSDFGKGRVFGADDAMKSGMVDRIATFDDTVQRLAGRRGTGPSQSASNEIVLQATEAAPVADPEQPASDDEAQARRRRRAMERRQLELS